MSTSRNVRYKFLPSIKLTVVSIISYCFESIIQASIIMPSLQINHQTEELSNIQTKTDFVKLLKFNDLNEFWKKSSKRLPFTDFKYDNLSTKPGLSWKCMLGSGRHNMQNYAENLHISIVLTAVTIISIHFTLGAISIKVR